VAGARHAVGAWTILPLAARTFVAIAGEARTLTARPGTATIVVRSAAGWPVTTRAIIAIEIATRWTITVTVEVTARWTIAVLAERTTRRIAPRTSLGTLLAASIVTGFEVALRTIVSVEVTTWRSIAVLAE